MSKKSKAKVPRPPTEAPLELGFQRVKSTYTAREISQLFGLDERLIRRWTREGFVAAVESASEQDEQVYDFRALTIFRRARELRAAGKTAAQIETALQGQLSLFEGGQGKLLELTPRLTSFEQALRLQEQGDEDAADLYRQTIEDDEYVADAYCNLGILEFEAGRIAAAVSCFTHSLAREPRHFESHFNLANLYFDSGDLSLARLHYEIGREIEPGFAHLHFNLGLAYALQGDVQDAIDALRRCRELEGEEQTEAIDQLLLHLERSRTARN